MSWLDKIQTQLTITTGDGRTYTPQWMNAAKAVEYNTAEFEFVGVRGTLVKRGQERGARYSIQIYFTGETHLDTAEAFRESASDPRSWTVEHPFYGQLTVQPISLEFDNTRYNTTEIRGTIVETITEDFPAASVVPEDEIAEQAVATNALIAASVEQDVEREGIPSLSIVRQRALVEKVNADTAQIISDADDTDSYYNSYNEALSAVNNIAAEPLEAMQKTQTLISAPAYFAASVRSRITILASTLNSIITPTYTPNVIDKRLIEANGGTVITSMCLSAATPEADDYRNRDAVIAIVELLLGYYNSYVTYLDSLQTDNGGSPTSYIPDADGMTELSLLVNYTLGNLFNLAIDARQERTLVVEYDTNWVVLAHRLYGLQPDDSTITELMEQNNAGINDMLQVRKNRKIRYYT